MTKSTSSPLSTRRRAGVIALDRGIKTETIKNKVAAYLSLLTLHRGEAKEAYDKVASIYDDFAKVWDHAIAAPALAYYNQIIEARVKPGALILEAAAGTGERTQALLRHSQPGEIIALDASTVMLDLARSKVQDPGCVLWPGI